MYARSEACGIQFCFVHMNSKKSVGLLCSGTTLVPMRDSTIQGFRCHAKGLAMCTPRQ